MRIRPHVAASALVALASTMAIAGAPVTLTDANVESNPITYQAGPFVIGTSNASCTLAMCDDTPLTIAVSPALASTMRVVAQIEWGFPTGSDFDLYIMQGENVFAASAGTADPEVVRFGVQNGDYLVHVDPYQPLGNSFTASFYLEPITASNVPLTGIAPSYDVFAPPENAAHGGEPSIGVNWNTGAVVVGNSNQAYFVNFDDSTSPAGATWVNRPPTTNLISFDPILFTDRETGRTVVSQLVSDVVLFSTGCSLSSYTDDDGHTWVPSEGCGPPAGADHQAVGGGPYHAPMSNLGPIYAHAVYYCAQAVGRVLADATCSRSDDGGLTYGPGVVVYTSECGGKHGHPRVAPDGTVYLPDESCADANGLHQGMAISTDNGASWHYSSIAESLPGQSDPSVATGLNDVGKPEGQPSNTVYFGYCDGDGLPKVAVSHDQGETWINVFNVGAAANIQNCVFPEMIAGDDNRAAMFFLGTPTPGNFQGADFTGEWHAYVATTLDGGASWGLSDATPKDPVQIGCIWLSGGGNACRNLLDFNDITVDREGRPVFVFADGCVPPDCAAGGTADTSHKAIDTIGRQSGGPRLFAQFDPPIVTPPVEPPVVTPPPTTSSDSRFGGALNPAFILMMLLALFARSASASTPASGTITPDGAPIAYSAGPFALSNTTFVANSTPPASCSTTEPCDEFHLTIDLPENYLDQHPSDQIRFVFTWGDPLEDFDVFLYDVDNNLAFVAANSPGPGAPESFALPAHGGKHEYVLRVLPSVVFGGTVNATITLTHVEPSTNVTAGSFTMQNFAAPEELNANGGEPSLAVNPKTNRAMFLSGLKSLRVTFDDMVQPATALWENVSAFFTSITTSDPILAGDRNGRIFVAQFVVGEGQSLGAFTDDDGETWTSALFGAEVRSGLDHETMGMGPYPAGFPLPHPLYDQAVYYCSQDLVTAECSRSDDGGLTFPVGVPIFGLGGGSIHGHVKVAPDGTVYVPARLSPLQNGVAVSEDGGLTWDVRVVPNTIMGRWDPSIGIGKQGTVYFGYANLGDDRPRIVVSRDKGKTWSDDTDVGAPLHIVNSVFAAVVAGDDDRAAYAFIASDKFGDSNIREFPGDWFLYVATTMDGGKSWQLVNATPGHPVQRGGICSNGIVCTGSPSYRNLLDFMDATMDTEGRILVGYADGCIDECDADPTQPNSYKARATIARQVDGPRLLSAFGPPVEVPPVTPPSTPTATSDARFGGALGLGLLLALASGVAARRRR